MALNLELTDIEEMVKNTALMFLRRDVSNETVQTLLETDTGYNEQIWQKAISMGWLGIIIPEEYGGTGGSLTSAGVLFEALGTGPLPGPYFSSGILASSILLEAGSEEQKTQFLAGVTAGTHVLTLALTEPAYSWEPASVMATGTPAGDDFVLNGVKLFTLDAGAATHFIVVARTGNSPDAEKGITLFLVEKQAPGISVRRLPGFLAGMSFEVKLDGVQVPRSAVLGKVNEGWPALMAAMDRSLPVLSAYKVGGCQALMEMAIEYSRVRVQFGQPIGRFQRVQDLIIEMLHHTEAARWTTYEALWKIDAQRPYAESVHLAKALSSQAYWDTCTLAHQVFSGISYSAEHAVSFHTRTSRSLYSFLGEPAYHRQKLARLLTV
jgi:alkylation response protein AidB-like acyl-CoA dehydrogenase